MRPPTGDLLGPNAITRMHEALLALEGRRTADEIFEQAGLAGYVTSPPTEPVEVQEFRALITTTHRVLGRSRALAVLADAGRRVGQYVLANRIPAPVRWLLPRLPAAWALRVLFAAMRQNAWTFAGRAPVRFNAQAGGTIEIISAPTAMIVGDDTACGFYSAAFTVLLQALVRPSSVVHEVTCAAMGASHCRFAVSMPR